MRRKQPKWPNLVSCGNCGGITTPRIAKTCIICGMMICGNCGDYCKNHAPSKAKESEAK